MKRYSVTDLGPTFEERFQMATRKESSWPPYTVTNRVITAVAATTTTTTTTTTTKAILIKLNLFTVSAP